MRRSSNPVLSSLSDTNNPYATTQTQDPYSGQYSQQAPVSNERPMTVDDVVSKTGITLGVIIAFAILNVVIANFNPSLAMMLAMGGALGGFVLVLVAAFSKKGASAPVTLIYAALEGLFVGGISLLFSGWMVGNENAGAMIGQAVLGTVGVFIGMLFVYKTGAVKVTPKFTRIITACLVGVMVLILGNLVMALFGIASPLRDGGPIAIVFSLVCIGLAAMSFLIDFDVADKLIRQGAPARMAWGVALGLAVTLVWLYTEILRLLSYFQQR